MAERVHSRLEDTAVELRELVELGVFTEAEVSKIAAKRMNHEFAIAKRNASLMDYLRYIAFEVNLETLKRMRRGRVRIQNHSANALYLGLRHLYSIYARALKKFPGDEALWMQYFRFCLQTGSSRRLSRAFGTALSRNPTWAWVWIEAAKYEFNENANMRAARALMQRALRLMPRDTKLWVQYCRLELMYWEKLLLRRELLGIQAMEGEESQQVLDGELPRIVFRNATQAIPDDLPFRVELLELFESVPGTERSRELVLESIRSDFPADERAYDVTARRADSLEAAAETFQAGMKAVQSGAMLDMFAQYLVDRLGEARTQAGIEAVLGLFSEFAGEAGRRGACEYTRLHVLAQSAVGQSAGDGSLDGRVREAVRSGNPGASAAEMDEASTGLEAFCLGLAAGVAMETPRPENLANANERLAVAQYDWLANGVRDAEPASAVTPDILRDLIGREKLQKTPRWSKIRKLADRLVLDLPRSIEAWLLRLDVELSLKDMQAARLVHDRAVRSLQAQAAEFHAACAARGMAL